MLALCILLLTILLPILGSDLGSDKRFFVDGDTYTKALLKLIKQPSPPPLPHLWYLGVGTFVPKDREFTDRTIKGYWQLIPQCLLDPLGKNASEVQCINIDHVWEYYKEKSSCLSDWLTFQKLTTLKNLDDIFKIIPSEISDFQLLNLPTVFEYVLKRGGVILVGNYYRSSGVDYRNKLQTIYATLYKAHPKNIYFWEPSAQFLKYVCVWHAGPWNLYDEYVLNARHSLLLECRRSEELAKLLTSEESSSQLREYCEKFIAHHFEKNKRILKEDFPSYTRKEALRDVLCGRRLPCSLASATCSFGIINHDNGTFSLDGTTGLEESIDFLNLTEAQLKEFPITKEMAEQLHTLAAYYQKSTEKSVTPTEPDAP